MKKRITEIAILPENTPLFSEMTTRVLITDEGGGEFVELRQSGRHDGFIQICPHEWPALRDAIGEMIDGCEGGEVEL